MEFWAHLCWTATFWGVIFIAFFPLINKAASNKILRMLFMSISHMRDVVQNGEIQWYGMLAIIF